MRKNAWITVMFAIVIAILGPCAESAAPRVSLTVMNPRAEIATPPVQAPQPRISDLAGKKIGIYWNGKAGGNHFWNVIEQLLKQKFPKTTIVRYDGPYEVSDKVAQEIASEIDAFFYGVGD